MQAENAPLRVVDGIRLVSAEIDHFDPLLLAACTSEWQRASRVVSEALCRMVSRVGDIQLWRRVLALVEQRTLEGRGDFESMRETWVRRP